MAVLTGHQQRTGNQSTTGGFAGVLLWLSLLWVVALSLVTYLVSNNSVSDWFIFAQVCGSGFVLSYLIHRRFSLAQAVHHKDFMRYKAQASAVSGYQQQLQSLEDVGCRISELASKQIEMVRSQTEDAVISLSQRFSEIVVQLNESLQVFEELTNSCANNISVTVNEINVQLSGLIEQLDTSKKIRRCMPEQISRLSFRIDQLQVMVESAQNLASKASLLGEDVANQATPAGEMERGSARPPDEARVRLLQPDETAKNICSLMTEIVSDMRAMVDGLLKIVDQDERDGSDGSAIVNDALEKMKQVTSSMQQAASKFGKNSCDIKAGVEHILFLLQFQDRCSQILMHVRNSLIKFHHVAGNQRSRRLQGQVIPLDVEQVFAELEAGYTTDEQFALHHGKSASMKNNEEIEYF